MKEEEKSRLRVVDLARWTLRAVLEGVILPFVLHPVLRGSE